MTMSGQVQLPASREVVWAKLNDPGSAAHHFVLRCARDTPLTGGALQVQS
jgi:hypothetical protein